LNARHFGLTSRLFTLGHFILFSTKVQDIPRFSATGFAAGKPPYEKFSSVDEFFIVSNVNASVSLWNGLLVFGRFEGELRF